MGEVSWHQDLELAYRHLLGLDAACACNLGMACTCTCTYECILLKVFSRNSEAKFSKDRDGNGMGSGWDRMGSGWDRDGSDIDFL